MDIIKEAIIKESKFGHITEGDRVLVIKIKGALFTSEDTSLLMMMSMRQIGVSLSM